MGFSEMLLLGVVALMVAWLVAPIVGIMRARMRRARGTHSPGAPILAGVSLGLLLLAWIFKWLLQHDPGISKVALLNLPLNVAWLWLALRANRAANEKLAGAPAPSTR